MALAEFKLSLSPGVILGTAAFIILSGAASARQCYWCGPLADQVHRSSRPPACSPGVAHLTVCEPGFQYCAVVATSPPYVESRYCVKLYQDECYPLFCNSTKSWRMTCPCRGDLCNGPNTDRENEAFTVLSKLVAKTHSRIKRTVTHKHKLESKLINAEDENELTINKVDENETKLEDIADLTSSSEIGQNKDTTTESSKDTQFTVTPKENVTTEVSKDIPISTDMIEVDIKSLYPTNPDRHGIYKHQVELQADEPKRDDLNDHNIMPTISTIMAHKDDIKPVLTTMPVDTTTASTQNTESMVTTVQVTDKPINTNKEDYASIEGSKESTLEEKKKVEPQHIMTTTGSYDPTIATVKTATPTSSNVPMSAKNKTKNEAVNLSLSIIIIVNSLLLNLVI